MIGPPQAFHYRYTVRKWFMISYLVNRYTSHLIHFRDFDLTDRTLWSICGLLSCGYHITPSQEVNSLTLINQSVSAAHRSIPPKFSTCRNYTVLHLARIRTNHDVSQLICWATRHYMLWSFIDEFSSHFYKVISITFWILSLRFFGWNETFLYAKI